jgi:sterol desaturase/sphingolipid hydroxylase (fatty acid hydroxylase superfamily)
VLASLVPTLGGCCIMGTHFVVLACWLAFRLVETVDAHSGYSFPFHPLRRIPLLYNVERHDFHHSHNTGCYGVFGFWDWICGTDKTFNEFKAKEALSDKSK